MATKKAQPKKKATKKKKKVRVLSKTELKYKYKQSNLTRKKRTLIADFDKLSAFTNPSQIITFKGKKAKVRTLINKVLDEIKRVNNEYDLVTAKRVKLTRGKYKPKTIKATPEEVEEVVNTPQYDLYKEYNIWNYNDCIKDILKLTNEGYTVRGIDASEDYLLITNTIKEYFKVMSSNDTLYLYRDETNLDLRFILQD
jgi:hypothetical protein